MREREEPEIPQLDLGELEKKGTVIDVGQKSEVNEGDSRG